MYTSFNIVGEQVDDGLGILWQSVSFTFTINNNFWYIQIDPVASYVAAEDFTWYWFQQNCVKP